MLAELLSQLEKEGPTPSEAVQSDIVAAFESVWQSLDSATQTLGCLLSLFAPAPIPQALLEQVVNETDVGLDGEKLEKGCSMLVQQALLQHIDGETYSLHDLIRRLFQEKLTQSTQADDLKRGFCKVIATVVQKMPQSPTLTDTAVFSPVVPHVAEAATTLKNWLSNQDLIWPFIGLSRFYTGQGSYEQAAHWYEHCLTAIRDRLGESHPDVATSLMNLALLYTSQGRASEAEPLYLQALEMRKRLLGESHPDVANSLNSLAVLYSSQKRYSKAEPLYTQALEMRKQLLGELHPDVALSLNNLAALYYSQERYSEAEPLHVQALEMRKQLLGELHPDVALSLNNLAALYNAQGRYSEAEPLYVEALEMYERSLGEAHPNIAIVRRNLDSLRNQQMRSRPTASLWQLVPRLLRGLRSRS